MEESHLRRLAADYLNNVFSEASIVLPFFDFHKQGITLSSYLRKTYFGENLRRLPYLNEVEIRPDVVGIISLPEVSNQWAYVLGEIKTKKFTMKDFRQCMNYMEIAHPYAGYLFFIEGPTEEVRRNIAADNHKFQGLNRWGSLVTKRVRFLRYNRRRFVNYRLAP